MRRALSLYLPMWPVDLARRREARLRTLSDGGSRSVSARPPERARAGSAPAGPPMLFVALVAGQQRVTACCEQALACGVRAGLTLAHARALLPHDGSEKSVRVLEHRPERDLAALRSLAEWMMRLAPVVALDPPDALLMDLTGCERLHSSDAQMVRTVARACTRLGIHARAALGPTFGSAWAMARYGPAQLSLIRPGRVREAISPLPVEALRIEEETAEALREVGIERIGHLLDVARSTLPSRFGDELLLRVDEALGEAMEVIEPVRPAPPPEAQMVFSGPTTQAAAIDEASRRLLGELCEQLARLERGVRRLDVTLERIDAEDVALAVSLSHPNRNPRHLWSMLAPKLERANLGFGVESVRLAATKTGRLQHTQGECWRDEDAIAQAEAERARGELIDTLVGRLGPDRVVRLEARQTHVPERVFRVQAVTGEGRQETKGQRDKGTEGELAARGGGVWGGEGDRPTLLFGRAEPAQVLAIAPEGPPKWLKWRGEEHSLVSAIGPERIVEEWWLGGRCEGTAARRHEGRRRDEETERRSGGVGEGCEGDPPARDYFKVQTESGRWLWLFRHLSFGRWFVHGEWA